MSKRDYLSAVLMAIKSAPDTIVVRLLISINRAQGLEAAWEALELAQTSPLIVGMDFSGNPNVRKFQDFLPVFEAARTKGIKVTIHTAEIPDPEELTSILAFHPERIGHCCYLDPDNEAKLFISQIPMEICLSSNMGTMELASVSEHHFERFFRSGYPVIVCTDDTTVFQTSLSQELLMLAVHCELSENDLKRLTKLPMNFVFDESTEVREKLKSDFLAA